MISIVAADGVIRECLPDETLLVFLSDTHIGGSSGGDIFDSGAELTMLLEDLHHYEGPVELVLAGDFLDVLRMEDVGGGDPVAATLARAEYRELFATLRAFAGAEGHRVVYVVGNHDAELWWNPRIRGTLQEAGLVDVVALSYAASFASLPDQLVYCEHGNQFDPASAISDYANPLDTPVSAHVLAEMIRPIGAEAVAIGGVDLGEVRYVFPLAAHPGPAEWIAGRIFYRFFDQLLRWLLATLALLVVAYVAYGGAGRRPGPGRWRVACSRVGPGRGDLWPGGAGVRPRRGVPGRPPDDRARCLHSGLAVSRAGVRTVLGRAGDPPAA